MRVKVGKVRRLTILPPSTTLIPNKHNQIEEIKTELERARLQNQVHLLDLVLELWKSLAQVYRE